MHTRLMTIAILAAASMTLHAQRPQTTPMPQPPDDPRPTITQTPVRAEPAKGGMTISGCLQQREAAKGTPPVAAERGGMPDDYMLTNVKMSPASTVSGIGVSTKYQVIGLNEADLKKHLNHHVELFGQIVPPGETGKPADDTPSFQAATVKMISLTCNAAQ